MLCSHQQNNRMGLRMQPHFCAQFRADFRADFEAKNAYRTKKSMQVNEKLLAMEKPTNRWHTKKNP